MPRKKTLRVRNEAPDTAIHVRLEPFGDNRLLRKRSDLVVHYTGEIEEISHSDKDVSVFFAAGTTIVEVSE